MRQSRVGTWPDYLIGTALPFIILVALHQRDRTGEGQFIDLSMCKMVTTMISQAILDYQMNGRVRSQQGNRDPLIVPHNVHRCAGENQKALC